MQTPTEQKDVSSNGIKYELNQENIAEVKEFLGEKYAIPDEIALQALTHRSFDSYKPHNEKLQALGIPLLRLYFIKHAINRPHLNNLLINGKNLDILGTPYSTVLYNAKTSGHFARHHGLNKKLFWKCTSANMGFEGSGEMKMSANLISSLIGAVNYIHGKKVAEEFIHEKLASSFEKTACYVQAKIQGFQKK